MSEPASAQKEPYAVEVEEGRRYAWCACGYSKNQPYCDGSHTAVGMLPVVFEAKETGTVYLCGCKRTGDQPYCDGSHQTV